MWSALPPHLRQARHPANYILGPLQTSNAGLNYANSKRFQKQ